MSQTITIFYVLPGKLEESLRDFNAAKFIQNEFCPFDCQTVI